MTDSGIYFYGGPFSNFVGEPLLTPEKLPIFLSPWMASQKYPLVEYLFQAAKALTVVDHEFIRTAGGPWVAKGRGRSVHLRPDWELVKYEVMLFALRLKFADPEFREVLLATGIKPIYEDSPTDFVWGYRNNGLNLLGKALMQVREELRHG